MKREHGIRYILRISESSQSKVRTRSIVTLLSYLAVITGFLSVIRHIHVSYLALFLAILAISFYLEIKRKQLISPTGVEKAFLPRWLLNILSLFVVSISFFRVDADMENLVTVGIETLLILSGIKLMEDKKPRDHLQIYIISLFLIAGSALLTLSISFVLYFALYTFVFTSGIVMLTYHSESSNLEMEVRTVAKVLLRSLLLPVLAIPLTVIFFTLLPRTNYPFLNFLNREVARSGFTETVKLGHISEIQEDATTVFRASMERVREDQLYWRGIVLDYFDGSGWKVREERVKADEPTLRGKGIKQVIYLEPYENRYLFSLDKPMYLSIRKAKVSEGMVITINENVSRRIRYEAYSVPSDVIPVKMIDRDRYLQLPERDMKRLRTFASSFAGGSDEELAVSIMDHLRKDYTYSLKRLPVSDHPLEDFLFSHRSGNCEYFASAMAVILRLRGIPSRLVGGYRGGYYNEIGGYYLVSQRNAHVWVEAYIDEKGWVRFDPTPPLEGSISQKRDILFKARLMMDTINYYWNAFVITYDLSKQMRLFNRVRQFKMPVMKPLFEKRALVAYLVGAAILMIFFIVIRYVVSAIKTPPEVVILRRFLDVMKRHGYIRRHSQGLEEFISGIKEPGLREKASYLVRELQPYIFGLSSIDRREKSRLMKMIKDIK